MATVSRIFVRNLPPSLSEPEFKSHFAATSPITDAKFIPHRRIGYVGYKTPEDASKAVKYFNKSFIRMSRIGVELAKGVNETNGWQRERKTDLQQKDEHGDQPPAKRARIDTVDKTDDPKLKEFLNVMQSRGKSRTWADGDVTTEPADTSVVEEITEGKESDDEYESIPKKRKRESPKPETESMSAEAEDDQAIFEGFEDDTTPTNGKDDNLHVPDQSSTPKTDADWLRTRTSRLLGLLDDDEIDVQVKPRDSPPHQKSTAETLESSLPKTIATSQTNDKEEEQEPESAVPLQPVDRSQIHAVEDTARLFVRNLSYETTNDDLHEYFSPHGHLEEVHIPRDSKTGASKGFAYVQFASADDASSTLQELDGKPFQGRLLHIIAAAAKKENTLDDFAISKLPHKQQQDIRRKQEATSANFRWNSLYMNPDAILSSVADRLHISKSELLDPTSSSAAVKQAHAETNIIQETKAYFAKNGVNLESFQKREYSDTAILVKNFPYGTTAEEIRQLFESHGSLRRLLMPPTGTIAVVDLEQPGQAKTAFKSLAYRKFKDSILFLEKAPKAMFQGAAPAVQADEKHSQNNKVSGTDLLDEVDQESDVKASATLFVRNLSFSTTTSGLVDLFKPLFGFKSARVKTKTDPKRPGQLLSMGFGFVEFRSKQDAQSARAALDGYSLDGHTLVIKESHKAIDAAEERRKEDRAKKLAGRRTKIIVKNLPFEATKKDIQQLFGPYGKLRSVRVPKKFDSSSRGFAFADFVTAREAENAMEALTGAHLLGRRLNMDFTAEETVDPEEEIEKMSKKVGKQADKMTMQNLTSGGRKKFSVNRDGDDEVDAD